MDGQNRGGARGRGGSSRGGSSRGGARGGSRGGARGVSRGSSRGGARGGLSRFRGDATAPNVSTTKREEIELNELRVRVLAEAPPRGGGGGPPPSDFSQLPLSRYTLSGLAKSKYTTMTQIQRLSIPHALAGRDVVGAAKTGSGKTLAFLVPLLESLHAARWSAGDGLGALVISPTRELATQIYEVLKNAGRDHFSLACGVLTGGVPFEGEGASLARLNVLIATPGRLLQHLEQTPGFTLSELRMLVLDEADRLLDMGFSDTLNSIMSYMPPPPQRQTLLFSATQTRRMGDLVRLTLSDPEFCGAHDASATTTPARLAQAYVIVPLQDKTNLLYSFLRSHTRCKVIVFVSACKQARFLLEAFRRLRPGVSLHALHGKMKQVARGAVFDEFSRAKTGVLFATDVASRGLDFPGVEWVLQLDAPEDVGAYIHRVGRTARFTSSGNSLLVLSPGEAAGLLPTLAAAKIPLTVSRVNPASALNVTGKLAAEVAADPELKVFAQRAFSAYVRSVALQPRRDVFNVDEMDLGLYAESLGLAITPTVKLPTRAATAAPMHSGNTDAVGAGWAPSAEHNKKNANKALLRLKESIAAAKAAKKAAAAAAAAGEATEGRAGRSVDSDEEEEDDDEEGGYSSGSASDASDGSGDSDGTASGLLKSTRPPLRPTSTGGADELEADTVVAQGLEGPDAFRMRRVIAGTRLLGSNGALRGADGLTRFERVAAAAAAKAGVRPKAVPPASTVESAAAAYTRVIADRLAAATSRDKVTAHLRVAEKHKAERARARGAEESGEEEEEQGVRLGGGSGSEEEEEEDVEEEVAPPPQKKPVAQDEAAALAILLGRKRARMG